VQIFLQPSTVVFASELFMQEMLMAGRPWTGSRHRVFSLALDQFPAGVDLLQNSFLLLLSLCK
jgi:hypothetical protein